jgi:hypothetical protein
MCFAPLYTLPAQELLLTYVPFPHQGKRKKKSTELAELAHLRAKDSYNR